MLLIRIGSIPSSTVHITYGSTLRKLTVWLQDPLERISVLAALVCLIIIIMKLKLRFILIKLNLLLLVG